MKVALYYPWIYLTSGAERVLLQLTGKSRHEWTLFTNHFDRENTFPEFRDRKVIELGRVSVRRSIWRVFLAAGSIFWQRLPLEGYDALVIVGEGLGDMIVLRNRSIPAISVCLTPLRIVFDPVYRISYLKKQGAPKRFALAIGSWMFRMLDRLAWRRYERVFCISRECLARVRQGRLGVPEKQEVLHVGIGIEPEEGPSDVFEPFFLLPGRIMWTKNIELAIQAFRIFRERTPEFGAFRLVIAGIVDRKSEAYFERLRRMAADVPGIEFHVHPNDAELTVLYQTCHTMLFTAFNEDWGIVPIEAMAFGKPVVAVNRGGPLESVRDGVQGFLEEPDPERFADRMALLAGDAQLARSLGAAGPARAKLFSWEAFAARIDQALDEIVGTVCHAEAPATEVLSLGDRATGD